MSSKTPMEPPVCSAVAISVIASVPGIVRPSPGPTMMPPEAAVLRLSSVALYRQLKEDGYPVCPECGEAPVTGEHCPPPRKWAPAKGEGETVELPPAEGAIELFERALERFRADITHLPHRREYLQAEWFTVHREPTPTGGSRPPGP